ncbi:HAD family hydrolase [Actinomadura harenae]|uniref:Hydrolase n=1 Tax=Actinomadura harenae TaxID=2483351 RepID=A0A3M2M164_9ACTN|nr:HAD-IB family phosphatase [Actinomadura harenae]RMI43276.1 hydrolase [Actinomadura harenae]
MGILHIFDMDGTLLTGSTASLQIARHTGTEAELADLEARFASGTITTTTFSTALYGIWRDRLTPDTVAAAYAASPWLDGIAEVCADIRARGEHSLVITMSPDFFARHLLGLGFDEVAASRFPPLPLAGPPKPGDILTPADKVTITDRVRARHGVPRDRCVAYGDSMSDAPLFRHLRHTVAINADHHLADLAALDYRGGDLARAYGLARTLLTPADQAQ